MAKKNNISKTSKLKKTILGIAIALVLVFFWGYSVNTIHKQPDFNEICKDISYSLSVDSCEGYLDMPQPEGRPLPVPEKGYCNCYDIDNNGTKRCEVNNPEYQKCNDEYEVLRENHGRVSFIALVILGLVSILIGGLTLKGVEAVSSGIMGGGVLTLLYSAIRYWGDIQDYARLAILGVALLVLIWIGYRKLRD